MKTSITWTPWCKSPLSGNTNCAEVKFGVDEGGNVFVGVRDSKNPDGPVLVFGAAAWLQFLGSRLITGA